MKRMNWTNGQAMHNTTKEAADVSPREAWRGARGRMTFQIRACTDRPKASHIPPLPPSFPSSTETFFWLTSAAVKVQPQINQTRNLKTALMCYG